MPADSLKEPVKEQVVDTEKESLKQRLALLEKYILENGRIPSQEVQAPIVNDVKAPLQKPKRILFTINATQDEDAQHEGAWIPGKAVVSLFKFIDALKCNQYGTRYTTGFEYDEIENTSGLEGEELQNYIAEVRVARQWIERYYPANLSADNTDFWKNRYLKIEDFDHIYDTKDNLENLILYYNIMGGGYTQIARSHDDAKSNKDLKNQRLYISIQEQEEERKFSHRGSSIQAMSDLQEILTKWSSTEALYLMYYLPIKKHKGYHAGTPMQNIINELADFIEGVDTKMDKKKRPQMFLDAVKLFKTNKDLVRTTAVFKAAQSYGFITYNSREKSYNNKSTGFNYGNSEKGAVEALLNPKHIDELSWIKAKVNEKWIS
jgi:hypothetical protein